MVPSAVRWFFRMRLNAVVSSRLDRAAIEALIDPANTSADARIYWPGHRGCQVKLDRFREDTSWNVIFVPSSSPIVTEPLLVLWLANALWIADGS